MIKTIQTRQKKESDFKAFFETYYAPFCLYAMRFVVDKEASDDIVSDVFVSLWAKLDSFDIHSSTALGYIKICVKNSCLNYLKHQEHEWNYQEFAQQKGEDYDYSPDNIYTLEELYEMLYKTLEQLPSNYRITFIESCFRGKSHAEIAEKLNVSVKSVNRYKQKAMELLREELKEFLPLALFLIILRVQ